MISSKRIYFYNIEMIYINMKMKIPCNTYGSCIGIHISIRKCMNIHVFLFLHIYYSVGVYREITVRIFTI